MPAKMQSQHGNDLKRFDRASPQRSPRRSTSSKPTRHGIPDSPHASPPRKTTVDRLSNSEQYRLRQLHLRLVAKRHSLLRREGGSQVVPSGDARDDGYGGGSARWKAAMKQVILGVRSTDAIIDRQQFKGRKLTYWHGIKIKKSSKATIVYSTNTNLAIKCRSCIDIVERAPLEAAERKLLAESQNESAEPEAIPGTSSTDPENRMPAEYAEAASPDELGLVFSFFHSIPELDGLDSIYQKRLLLELRVRRFAAGSTVIGGITPSIGLFTARCTEATVLMCLDCDRFSAVLNDSASAERIARKNILKRSPVFSTLTDEDLNTLEALFTTITLHDNQVLCKEGFTVDHVYVVKRGFLRIFKAFLPEDGQRPRPPSRASLKESPRPASRGSSSAGSRRPSIVKNGAESSKRANRLMHFDLGEIGPKDILGENGVLQQVEISSSTPVISAPASTTLPTIPGNQEAAEDGNPHQQLDETRADPDASLSTTGDAQGGGGALRPHIAKAKPNATAAISTADGAPLSSPNVRQRKAAYLVSATASGGTAEVYVAKAHDLKRVQTETFRYCWKTAQRLHQARAQAWSAGALGKQLRRQQEWESFKSDVLSNK